MRFGILFLLFSVICLAADSPYSFEQAQGFLQKYCRNCHGSAGGFKLESVADQATLRTNAQKWTSLSHRITNSEMPPKGSPAPSLDERERFTDWVQTAVRERVCADASTPVPPRLRRLNRDEYAATIRDLLDMHMDIGRNLPADGSGGEGFDNAAETLFLSPLHTEKYLDTAKFALDFAAKEFKSRRKIFSVMPGAGLTERQAARQNLATFLPRAFRRPVTAAEVDEYVALYDAARKRSTPYDAAVLFAVRSALVSPNFLFHIPDKSDYAFASRLSYFLWGSMPDEFLFDVAASGKLRDPEVIQQIATRMLRNERSVVFAQRFVDQWLRTRELDGDKAPDAKLFPTYAASEDLRSDIRYQPVLFFRELILRNMPVLELIDSKYTIGTSNLEKHYGIKLPLNKNARTQPQWLEAPEGSNRGGLLGMAAVLATSSHPYRTSPVLRGAWILDSMLGTPPPPPPPNVPPLEEPSAGTPPKSMRERLDAHRANTVCASCHSRIDGLGFALENYDVLGRWREADAHGELQDGTKLDGPASLKAKLLERKDLFVRNITSKLLGYALGRGLTLKDSCVVDSIAAKVRESNYSARALVDAVVMSAPFRYEETKP